MSVEFQPMRSLIYVDCVKEEYRHKLQHWLYRHHIPDSISQFGPYVSKYAFYNALPTPPEGERFGAISMQLTEHYWLVNPMTEALKNKAFTEYFPQEVLKWQGTIPDSDDGAPANMEGDAARATGGDNGMPPFIFAFIPVWWEEDLKGAGRTANDGPNYRWQFVLKYPDSVSQEAADQWFFEKVIPVYQAMPEVNRILTSKIMQEVNGCPFQRVVELWFEGPDEWRRATDKAATEIRKPEWATCGRFPYFRPKFEMASLFLSDIATSDNYTQYRGYMTMR